MPPRKKLSPSEQPLSPALPPLPLKVIAPVATRTGNGIALGVLMICCVTLLTAFGASMAAGIVKMAAGITPVAVSCSETDGDNGSIYNGRNYFVKGTTTVIYSNGTKRVEKDVCNNTKTLREWYCGKAGDPAGLLRADNYVTCAAGCSNGACVQPVIITISSSTNTSQSQIVAPNAAISTIVGVKLVSTQEPAKITQLKFMLSDINALSSVANVSLSYDGQSSSTTSTAAAVSSNGSVIFNNLNIVIPQGYSGLSVYLNLKVSSAAVSGSKISFYLDPAGMVGSGLNSGKTISAGAQKVYGNTFLVRKAYPSWVTMSYPANVKLLNGTVNLTDLIISAAGGLSIGWQKIGLSYYTTNYATSTISLSNCYLKNSLGNVSTTAIAVGKNTIDIELAAARNIRSSYSDTVKLYCSVTGVAGPSGASSISLMYGGSQAPIGTTGSYSYLSTLEKKFLWRDYSSVSSASSTDWCDSSLVPFWTGSVALTN